MYLTLAITTMSLVAAGLLGLAIGAGVCLIAIMVTCAIHATSPEKWVSQQGFDVPVTAP